MINMWNKNQKTLWIISMASSLIIGSVIGSTIMYLQTKNNNEIYNDPNIQKIIGAYETLKDQWYFGKDIENYDAVLAEAAINGMTNNGDPYTFYTQNMESQGLSTQYYGIGISSSFYGGNRYLMDVFKDSPADKAGLKIGDIITGLEKKQVHYSLSSLPRSESEGLFQFDKDEEIKIDYTRNGESCHTVAYAGSYTMPGLVVRESSPSALNIQIETFLDGNVANTLKKEIDSYISEYSKIENLIIDLRDNGGGYVSAAVNMTSLFVPHNATIMSYEYQNGDREIIKNTNYPCYTKEKIKKISILQNYNTASASEIFILAMKDLCPEWISIIGTRSYGKGIAQSFETFDDGSVIRYTFAKSFGPNGVSIHNVGILPDYLVDIDTHLLLTYMGERNYYSDDDKELLKREISLVLNEDYSNYEDAMETWLLSIEKDEFDMSASRILQMRLFDIFISLNQSMIQIAKGNV